MTRLINQSVTKVFVEQPRLHRVCTKVPQQVWTIRLATSAATIRPAVSVTIIRLAVSVAGLQKIQNWLGTDQKWLPCAVARTILKIHILVVF